MTMVFSTPRTGTPGVYARRLFLILGLVFLPALLSAQSAGQATLEGRVFDAARGNTLPNARLTLEDSGLEAFTDSLGFYRFTRLPAGEWRLRVFYTGLSQQTAVVKTADGQTTEKDFLLTEAPASEGREIVMEAFVVSSQKETNQTQLAINEQRFAPNFTNVVAVDEFGITSEGNVGEFVKFLPGVQVGGGQDAREIGIGGVSAAYTPINLGGISLASASSSNASRTVELEQVSLTNLSRIEIDKSPVPDQRADAIGGSVNLIPKSAFERLAPEYRYRLYFTGNDGELLNAFDFRKVPGRGRREPHPTTLFSYELGAIVPVNKRLGFTFSLADSNRVTALSQPTMTRSSNTAIPSGSVPTTPDRPYAWISQMVDGGAYSRQRTVAGGIDFRLGRYDTFRIDYSYTYFNSTFANNTLVFNLGRVAAFSPTFSQGVSNVGTVTQTGSARAKDGSTYTPSFRWMHRGPVWTLEGIAGFSHATNYYRDVEKGFLQAFNATITGVTIAMEGIGPFHAENYAVSRTDSKTGAATPVDPYDISSYNIRSGGTAAIHSLDLVGSAKFSAKRTFWIRFPLTLKSGVDFRSLEREIHRGLQNASSLNYVGPDRIANSSDDAATSFLDPYLSQKAFIFGQPRFPWVDRWKLYETYRDHPDYFTKDLAAEHRARATGEKSLSEAVTAAYVRADAKFFQNRLLLTTGVRWERTDVSGEGNLIDVTRKYLKDANGKVLLDAKGAGILRPEFATGNKAADDLAIAQATYLVRGARTDKAYADYYPSVNAAYNLTPNLIARGSYASTLGRPNLGNIIPGISIPDPRADGGQEVITYTNADLLPWTADNYALGLEYYFSNPSSGSASVRAFRRNITNFFVSRDEAITPEFREEYGLDEANYGNAIVRSTTNSAVENRIFGLELAYSQDLGFLPRALGRWRIFANATLQRTTPEQNNFSSNLPKAIYNWGIRHQWRRLTYSFNWNYRGRLKQGMLTSTATNGIGPLSFNYEDPRLTLDGTIEYEISRRVGLFIGAKNIQDTRRIVARYGPETPDYARVYLAEAYGASYFFGIKGSF